MVEDCPPVRGEHWVFGGVISAAVLAVLLVALSTYCRRRGHPAVRSLVWGASILFLPLTSSVISYLLRRSTAPMPDCKPPKGASNHDIQTMWNLLLWVVLILTVNAQRVRPHVELLAQYATLAYLILVCLPVAGWLGGINIAIFITFSVLSLAKLALNMLAVWKGGNSYAVGKNARLIAGYMEQPEVADGQELMPRYIVMGETKEQVEEIPQGYRIKRDVLDHNESRSRSSSSSRLVTLDRVWRLAEDGYGIFGEQKKLRDLCLSYSLFKILRRRLSGYPLADAGSDEALDFVLRGMDSVGAGADADRVFRVLEDEFWFASDFYYSPIPLCILGGWWAILNYLCSVLIITGAIAVGSFYVAMKVVPWKKEAYIGVITYFLLLVVVLVEIWEIVAAMCSNWTKIALLGHYTTSRRQWMRRGRPGRVVDALLAAVLRLRPARLWRDKMGQNSVLEPGRFRRRTGLLSEKFYGQAGLMESIKISEAVKEAVLSSLLRSYGRLSKGSSSAAAAARGVGGKVDWALYGTQKSWAWDRNGSSSNTDQILMWHVATRLFEIKLPSAAPDMIATSHLSNYCAYLVAAAPELLPDCAAWTQRRYKEVTEDLSTALGDDDHGGGGGGESTVGRYERLVAALSAHTRDTARSSGGTWWTSTPRTRRRRAGSCRTSGRRWCSTSLRRRTSRATSRPWRAAASSSRSYGRCSFMPASPPGLRQLAVVSKVGRELSMVPFYPF